MTAGCVSALRITATDTVTCMLPDQHSQHTAPDGVTPNLEPAYHQGAALGQVFVWSTSDAGIMNTLRNGGFHDQCNLMAPKFGLAAQVRDALRQAT